MVFEIVSREEELASLHAFIDEVARAGADAVKFQTHIASAESTPAEPFRVKFSRQENDYFKYHQIYLARGRDHAGNEYGDPTRTYEEAAKYREEHVKHGH